MGEPGTAIEYAAAHAEEWLTELEALARIPSVSTDPAFVPYVRQAAEWLCRRMKRAGLEQVDLEETDGHPVVYGHWMGAGASAPTVLLYAHYDVQPAVREDGWDSDPFEPVRRDGKIYARGIGDDKIHSVMIVQVAESLISSFEGCPVNLKLVIEGEEEMGSPNFVPWVKANSNRLAADYCLICDGGIISVDQPAIVHALRGLVALQIDVQGPATDLHSGANGGMVHNPAQAIAEMIARLHDETGRVLVPGFYDEVVELTATERERLNASDVTESEYAARVGAPMPYGEPGYSLVERTTTRPTLEINGIYAGYSGEGIKTVIPARAHAKITCRLVPDQSPQTIANRIEKYLNEIAPPTISLSVTKQGEGDPLTIPTDGVMVRALRTAFAHHWSVEPRVTRMGGSIPIVPVLANALGIDCLPMGFNVVGAGFHGPNEYIHAELFSKGLDTLILLLQELAVGGKA